MTDMSSKEAAAALRAADQALQAGTGVIGPRHRLRYLLVTGLLAVLFGACFDIPPSLWGVGAIIRFPLPMVIVFVWTWYTRNAWRARPRIAGYSARILVALVALHLGCFAAAALFGVVLRTTDIPVPFTVAGLAYASVMAAVITVFARGLAARYAERVAREHR